MTSHDVRKMHTCTVCGRIGFYALPGCDENCLVVAASEGTYAHPRCFRAKHGLNALLALPKTELESVRLCDVSVATMAAIVTAARELAK
jgi:hypothetical protein